MSVVDLDRVGQDHAWNCAANGFFAVWIGYVAAVIFRRSVSEFQVPTVEWMGLRVAANDASKNNRVRLF